MKPIAVTLHLQCRDDVPADVLSWIAESLADYVSTTFGVGYDPTSHPFEYHASPLLYGRVYGQATADDDALDNERAWRSQGAPPSGVRLPEDEPGP